MATQTVPSVPHQMALSGSVVDDETSRPLAGVTVTITTMPPAFQRVLAGKALQYGALWATLAERPDRTATTLDGSFHFVDLPDGAYAVTCTASRAVGIYGSAAMAFSVARDAEGHIAWGMQTIRLPPMGIRGIVEGNPPGSGPGGVAAPIPGVRVRVRGNSEVVHSGSDGRFYLPDAELGTLTLELAATNYAPVTTTAVILDGTITDLGTVTLTLNDTQ
jgi:hypothetical protein